MRTVLYPNSLATLLLWFVVLFEENRNLSLLFGDKMNWGENRRSDYCNCILIQSCFPSGLSSLNKNVNRSLSSSGIYAEGAFLTQHKVKYSTSVPLGLLSPRTSEALGVEDKRDWTNTLDTYPAES